MFFYPGLSVGLLTADQLGRRHATYRQPIAVSFSFISGMANTLAIASVIRSPSYRQAQLLKFRRDVSTLMCGELRQLSKVCRKSCASCARSVLQQERFHQAKGAATCAAAPPGEVPSLTNSCARQSGWRCLFARRLQIRLSLRP